MGKIEREQLSPGFNAELNGFGTQLSEKVNKSSIVNNLSTTVSGSLLDATQGKILNDNILATNAKLTDSGWINIPLGVATAGVTIPSYRKIGKVVTPKGYFSNITANNSVVGTLPVGFRPPTTINLMIPCGSVGNIARIAIDTTGVISVISINTTHSNTILYFLDNISFLVD